MAFLQEKGPLSAWFLAVYLAIMQGEATPAVMMVLLNGLRRRDATEADWAFG